jgi:hypothetical protein
MLIYPDLLVYEAYINYVTMLCLALDMRKSGQNTVYILHICILIHKTVTYHNASLLEYYWFVSK